MKKNILLLLVAVLVSACSTDMVYSRFEPIVYEGQDIKGVSYWHKDSLVSFEYGCNEFKITINGLCRFFNSVMVFSSAGS